MSHAESTQDRKHTYGTKPPSEVRRKHCGISAQRQRRQAAASDGACAAQAPGKEGPRAVSSADNSQDSDSDEASTSSSSHGAGGLFHFSFNVRQHGRGILKVSLLNALAHGCIISVQPPHVKGSL